MEILHNESEKIFYFEQNGLRIAELTYVYGGEGKIAINHTYVEPDHRGEGLAKELAIECVKYARENSYKVIPVCSFAVTFFRRYEEYADVLL